MLKYILTALTGVTAMAGPLATHAQIAPDTKQDIESRMAESSEQAIRKAVDELQLKTDFHRQTWGIDSAAWDVDLDQGEIRFHNDQGWLISAKVQVVGTYDRSDGTFMWGWDHPSVPEHAAETAKTVKLFGERHERPDLTERLIYASEDEAWQYTALAAHLAGDSGAYRGNAGSTLVYMTFDDLKITKND